VYGNAVSVLAGDALLVHSLQRTLEHSPELLPDLLRALESLVNGEILQLRGRSEIDLSETTYEHILSGKTASLFRFATSSGARLAGASSAEQASLGEFGEHLGIAFQLVDDVLDYTGAETGKTLFQDLREGKVTLPLVLAVQDDRDLQKYVHAVHQGDDKALAELRTRVLRSGACERVRDRARSETQRAIHALRTVRSSAASLLLGELAAQLAARAR
jgi:octaprenyl-diphosphate synthase